MLLCAVAICLCLVVPRTSNAQSEDNRFGLSCAQVLAMNPEQWAEYCNKKNPGGEAGYDQAYEAYANCMKRRNDTLLAKLLPSSAGRLRKYRALCGKFRVDQLELQQAYAGGGTMYTHATVRGQVEDEELIGRLAKIYSGRTANGHGGASSVTKIKNRLSSLNPATPSNRKKLEEFSMSEQANSAYKESRKDFAALEALLVTERPDARRLILKFLDDYSRVFSG